MHLSRQHTMLNNVEESFIDSKTTLVEFCKNDKYRQIPFYKGIKEEEEISEDNTEGKSEHKDEQIGMKRKNLIPTKNLNGEDTQIMSHTLYEEKVQELTLIMHVRAASYYFFLFVMKNTQE